MGGYDITIARAAVNTNFQKKYFTDTTLEDGDDQAIDTCSCYCVTNVFHQFVPRGSLSRNYGALE